MSDEPAVSAPGAPVMPPTAPRRWATCLLVLAIVGASWALLQLYALERVPFHTTGEPREAVVVQDLVQRGNWILPKRNGAQLPRKPPLFYWLAGIAAHARGVVDEAAVRLPSAILSGIACLLVAGLGAALYGGAAGVVSGLTLMTSFEWLRAATTARVDMTLAFGLTLVFVGLLCFRRQERPAWLLVFYLGATWATLSKGVPGLAIPALQVLLVCILLDRSLTFVWRLRPILGLLVVLLVTGAWYAAAALQGGRAFLTIVANENLTRVVGATDFTLGHSHSLGYLIGMLVVGLLPWTLLVPSTAAALWKTRGAMDRFDPRLFSLLWIVAVFAPYAVATSKRGVYLLPLYPAVCLLIGWWAAEVVRGAVVPRSLARLLAPLGWVLGVAFGVLAFLAAAQAAGLGLLDVATQFVDPGTALDLSRIAAAASAPGSELAAGLAVAAGAAAVLACAAGLRRWGVALAAMFLCVAAASVAVRAIVLPAIAEGKTRKPFANALRRVVGEPAALSTSPSLDFGTIFYWGQPLPVYSLTRGDPPPPYLLLPEGTWLRMSPATRRLFHRVPGLTIEAAGNQGYAAVVQRIDDPTGSTAEQ